MKKFIFTVALALACMLPSQAQMPGQQVPPAPVDTALRMGTLPNGLTYYVRHNENPKGQADFYIAQRVGSILEEDNQRGLAHFLEHMAFNGSEHFPAGTLVSWCEKNGIKFGRDLNAATGMEQTVYNVANVPTARQSLQDSVLYILYDWADGLTLDPTEIDKERGVIHEEWRSRNVGQQRLLEQLLPKVYPGTRHGVRLPIGTMEVVDNFPPQALRDYYEKWYRPDNQAIIVVGDIDPAYIEGKIKDMFSGIKMPENPAERVYYDVPDTPGTIYAIGKDKEMQAAMAMMFFKNDLQLPKEMRNSIAYFPVEYLTDIVPMMLNNRLSELTQKPDAEFAMANTGYGDFFLSPTKEAFSITVMPKDGDLSKALAAVYREVRRAVEHGFTHGEFERAKAEYLSRLEKSANNEAKRKNGGWVSTYTNNFLDNTPLSTPKQKYEIINQMSQLLPLEAFNQFLPQVVGDSNRVVLAMVPDKEGFIFPTEEQMAAALKAIDGETLEGYKDEMKAEPLIPQLPTPGKVVSEKKDALYGATELILSNGVKVYVLPTNYEDNQILFSAYANGGYQDYPESLANELLSYKDIMNGTMGLGEYTNLDLQKYTQGKQASVYIGLDDVSRTVSGTSTVKDLPTLMELLYMNFTAPTFDASEYEAAQKNYATLLANQENTPDYKFSKRLIEHEYDSPLVRLINDQNLLNADRQKMQDMVRNAVKNAGEYTFAFVGNVDLATLKPLLEQYVATLPADTKSRLDKVPAKKPGFETKPGRDYYNFQEEMETPQTTVVLQVTGQFPVNTRNFILAQTAGQILSQRLIQTVREDMGAVYSISAGGNLSREGSRNALIVSQFPMKPEMKDTVLTFIENEMKAMTQNVKPEELAKVQEYLTKSLKENKEKNIFWMNNITGIQQDGIDLVTDRQAVIDAMTPADVQAYMNDLLKQGNYRVTVMDPKAKEATK